MAKRFTASVKQLKPDARFGSVLASKFINCLIEFTLKFIDHITESEMRD